MKTYKVTEQNGCDYHGCGYALGVIVLGELASFQYLEDIDDEFNAEDDVEALEYIDSGALENHIKGLAKTGQVHLGMLSCWEFCDLGKVAK